MNWSTFYTIMIMTIDHWRDDLLIEGTPKNFKGDTNLAKKMLLQLILKQYFMYRINNIQEQDASSIINAAIHMDAPQLQHIVNDLYLDIHNEPEPFGFYQRLASEVCDVAIHDKKLYINYDQILAYAHARMIHGIDIEDASEFFSNHFSDGLEFIVRMNRQSSSMDQKILDKYVAITDSLIH